MIVFISGMITNDPNYKEKFQKAQTMLETAGHIVLNPISINPVLPYNKQIELCFSMIDISDAVYFLPDWSFSKGSRKERLYVRCKGKPLLTAEEI